MESNQAPQPPNLLKEQYKSAKEPATVRLPIALALINIGLNSDNLKLPEQDFLYCVMLAKEVRGVSDAIKLKLLKAFGDYLNYIKDNMSQFNTTIFTLLEEYTLHILLLENRSDELSNTVISILLNIVSAIPQVDSLCCKGVGFPLLFPFYDQGLQISFIAIYMET